MTQGWTVLLGGAFAALLCAGCNGAKGDYERCLELEHQGKLEEASKACEFAMQKDPNGATGKAAQEKYGELQARVVGDLVGQVKKNNECTEAQLALIDAKPEDKARLTAARDAKCSGVLPKASAAPSPSAD
ncbi:MAG: hypothetical protein KC766_29505 [Myxococcales bacterium]|nr:hypothetical protein [Myxococcales bacterium]